jgi:hypothetical protein
VTEFPFSPRRRSQTYHCINSRVEASVAPRNSTSSAGTWHQQTGKKARTDKQLAVVKHRPAKSALLQPQEYSVISRFFSPSPFLPPSHSFFFCLAVFLASKLVAITPAPRPAPTLWHSLSSRLLPLSWTLFFAASVSTRPPHCYIQLR